MSIHAADALMGIFGFKRVADDKITLDSLPPLDDDSGSLNEGMKMSEVKNDGLEVVGWYRMDDRKAITPYPSVCATWHKMGAKVGAAYSDSAQAIIDGLRGENEALHAQVKVLQSGENSWQSGYDQGRLMGAKHCTGTIDQLRAELADAKETITRYETTAENCEVFRAELAAIKAQVPVAWEVYYADDDSFHTITRDKALIKGYSRMAYTIKPLYAAPVAKQDNDAKMPCWAAVSNIYEAYEAGLVAKQVVMPERIITQLKDFVEVVRGCERLASSYSGCIDGVDEHGGDDHDDPICAVFHRLYYAMFDADHIVAELTRLNDADQEGGV